MRHAGAPVALPAHRLSRREIVDSEEGVRLLADHVGHWLREVRDPNLRV